MARPSLNNLRLKQYWILCKRWTVGGRKPSKTLNIILAILSLILIVSSLRGFAPQSLSRSDFLTQTGDETLTNEKFAEVSEADTLLLRAPYPPPSFAELTEDGKLAEKEVQREYGILVDAGSSGSRVYVYSWMNPDYVKKDVQRSANGVSTQERNLLHSLPVIERGSPEGIWNFKSSPGISTFGDNPVDVGKHLKPLLDFAKKLIPPRKQGKSPFYLMATAGMRLLPDNKQKQILESACAYTQMNYPFVLAGGCSVHFKVISGELEGIYGWLTVNYLRKGFNVAQQNEIQKQIHTFGFLDMGGASTQIAFEPTFEMYQEHKNDLTPLKLRLMDGSEEDYNVFVTTFLGFGINEARRRYVQQLIDHNDSSSVQRPKLKKGYPGVKDLSIQVDSKERIKLADSCLPHGLTYQDTMFPHYELIGRGNFSECLLQQIPLLNKSVPCVNLPCLFNGVHVPITDFRKHAFLGVSEYWYTSAEVYNLGGTYNATRFLESTKQFCAEEWTQIQQQLQDGYFPHLEGGTERLSMQCFKSAWILAILHDGLGIPRTDAIGGRKANAGIVEDGQGLLDKIPTGSFESVNEIGAFGLSWTLGALLMHISKTIQKPSNHSTKEAIAKLYTQYNEKMPYLFLVFIALALLCAAVPIMHWRRSIRKRRSNTLGPGAHRGQGSMSYRLGVRGTGSDHAGYSRLDEAWGSDIERAMKSEDTFTKDSL